MKEIKLTKEEKDAVLIQLTYRIQVLEDLMCKAGADKNVKRMFELSESIKILKSGTYKIMEM